MQIQNISSKIISTLGNPSSLVPLMIKDGVDSASLTYYSYKAGGKIEGRDRAIDEFGTQAIWIGGIPFFKKLIDKTAYKLAKINPDVDPRVIKNSEYAKWALDNANGFMGKTKETVKDALDGALQNVAKTKKLYVAKVIAATALTLVSYFTLTKMKQKSTKQKIEQQFQNSQLDEKAGMITPENQEFLNHDIKKNVAFNAIFNKNTSKNPAFKGIISKVADGIMFNPVHNMKLIDAGITTERLAQSRNKTEFAEHAIKEGIFLFFMYGLGNVLQAGIDKFSKNILKRPIDLNIQVLMDDGFKKALESGKLLKDAAMLPDKKAPLSEFLGFLSSNSKNTLVEAAKKSGIISTVKTGEIDTSKFISREAVEGLSDNLKSISEYFTNSKISVEKYLKKTKGLKVASVLANLAICSFVLGYVVPELVYKYRKKATGTTDFHVAKDIENECDKKSA